jgi:hypothetical protein
VEVGRWRAGRASAPVGGNPSVTRRRGQGSPGRSLSCRCCPRLSQNRIDFFPQALQGRSACATPGSVTRDVQQPWLSCARKHRLPAVLARFGALRGGEMDGAGPRRARAGRPSGAGAVVAHKLTSASCRLRSCFVTLGPRGNGRAVSGVRPAIAWARARTASRCTSVHGWVVLAVHLRCSPSLHPHGARLTLRSLSTAPPPRPARTTARPRRSGSLTAPRRR